VAKEVGQGLGRGEVLQRELPQESWQTGDEIMKLFVAIIGSLLPVAVAAFCLFGLLATFEPTTNTTQFMVFRIGYATVGVGCLAGICVLIFRAISSRDSDSP
jgi:hypothetical protein